MKKIVTSTLAKVKKDSTLDEIKAVMKEECAIVSFKITNDDWNEMFDDVISSL